MKVYALSLLAGVAVGVFYGLLQVRSPAPPVVALIGLFGILAGEQIPPVAKGFLKSQSAAVAWLDQVKPHVFGHLPSGKTRMVDSAAFSDTSPTAAVSLAPSELNS